VFCVPLVVVVFENVDSDYCCVFLLLLLFQGSRSKLFAEDNQILGPAGIRHRYQVSINTDTAL